MEKETLEEAAEKYARRYGKSSVLDVREQFAFKAGATWRDQQDETKYSEEAIWKLLKWLKKNNYLIETESTLQEIVKTYNTKP